jgi:N-acetylneuraminic acid mutarotase
MVKIHFPIGKTTIILFSCLFIIDSTNLAQSSPWNAKTPLPFRSSWLSSCVVEGKIYVVGGATDNTVLSAVEVYDPASDSWDTTKAKMSGNRWGLSANVVDGKIHAIGGVEGATGSALSKVEVYDPVKDTWELKAKMPTARVGFASCALDNKIYILGGAASEPFQTPLNKVEVYDPHSDSWDTSKSSLSTAIAYPAACTVNGKIYLIGGTTQSPWTGSVKIEEYDPATDKWTRKKDMPTGRWALTACVVNGKIYVVGGTESPSSGGSSKVEEYDPSTDTWKTRAEMPTPRLALSASEVDGKVYALGGATVGYPWIPSVATVEEFDPDYQTNIPAGNVTGTWTLSNSPYDVNGEITVPNGETLSIERGVDVVFTGHYKFNVQGRLLAIGTEKDTITFTAQDQQTGWSGLKFPSTPSTNDTSKVIYCILQYGQATQGSENDRLGGAIYVESFNKLIISHCLITKNKTSGDLGTGGGGIIMGDASPIIENNIISYNTAEGGHGGGVSINNGSNPVIKNNLIYENHSAGGGGITVYQSNPVFINNTIVQNFADSHGGAACIIGCSPQFVNTIIFGNNSPVGSQIHCASGAEPNFYYCNIQGGSGAFARDGVNGGSYNGMYQSNIDKAPLFVNPTSDNYRLSDASPCIGAGSDSIQINTNWYRAPHSDNDGNVRPNPVGSKPDIGAFESPLGSPLTSIHEGLRQLPNGFQLYQNYPNPFNPRTTIRFSVPFPANVKLHVYDCLGREVKTLLDAELQPGEHSVLFDANGLSSGFYFYRLQTGDFLQCQKCVVLK